MLTLLAEAFSKNPEFRFNLGMSGTFLEQAKEYSPELIKLMQDVISEGTEKNR